MKDLINEIDDLLISVEDTVHGDAGEKITEARAKLREVRKKVVADSENINALDGKWVKVNVSKMEPNIWIEDSEL